MIVIADATVCINLAKIDLLGALPSLYGEVIVSPTVFREVTEDQEKTGSRAVKEARWVSVREVKDLQKVRLLLTELDEGEAESIALALEQSADLVLVDELRARNKCQTLGIAVKGTLGILLVCYKRGIISDIERMLDDLISKGTWIDEELYTEVLALAKRMR